MGAAGRGLGRCCSSSNLLAASLELDLVAWKLRWLGPAPCGASITALRDVVVRLAWSSYLRDPLRGLPVFRLVALTLFGSVELCQLGLALTPLAAGLRLWLWVLDFVSGSLPRLGVWGAARARALATNVRTVRGLVWAGFPRRSCRPAVATQVPPLFGDGFS